MKRAPGDLTTAPAVTMLEATDRILPPYDDGDTRVTRTALLPLPPLPLTPLPAAAADRPIDSSRDIRPILAHHCWSCHGPDEKAREAGLRLDTRDGALARREQGKPAIVPGKPAASALVARIEAEKPSRRMPPPAAKKPLDDRQKQLLRRWIGQGADDSLHCACVAPRRPAVPGVRGQESAVRNPIDAFILAKLRAVKLEPSPEADRTTLLRRVTLDLTGLPPTLAELEAFLADS